MYLVAYLSLMALIERAPEREWTFLSNHGHVLLCLAADPEARIRDVAERVGITERAVHRIVDDLEEGGYVTRQREGRRNRYLVHTRQPLRHPIEAHHTIASLLSLVARAPATGAHTRGKPR